MAKAISTATTEFEKLDRCADLDHRPRVLLGKMGLDGHDRGVKVIARGCETQACTSFTRPVADAEVARHLRTR